MEQFVECPTLDIPLGCWVVYTCVTVQIYPVNPKESTVFAFRKASYSHFHARAMVEMGLAADSLPQI